MNELMLTSGGFGFIGTTQISELLAQVTEQSIRMVDNLETRSLESFGEISDFASCSAEEMGSYHQGVYSIELDIRDNSFFSDALWS